MSTKSKALRIDQFVEERKLELARSVKILVVGAGGLGCEILKCLAMSHFEDIHVIDLDVIELTNLNRQFLFSVDDIGKPKAIIAARTIQNRFPKCKITPHFGSIQDKDLEFYSQFSIIVCGLDSLSARRWINSMVHSLLEFDSDENLDMSSVVPFVDGGSEGFAGSVRTVIPGVTACLECNLDLFANRQTFPLCTLAHNPRLPEHCVEYSRMVSWAKENPFPDAESPDFDNEEHVRWLHRKALERAKQFEIDAFPLSFTLGVIKHIVPAVATTNAMIAAQCVLEVLNVCAGLREEGLHFSSLRAENNGISIFSFDPEKRKSCLVCGTESTVAVKFDLGKSLQDFITHLEEDPLLQMQQPSLTLRDDECQTLYVPNIKSLRLATEPNLSRSLAVLGVKSGSLISVADTSHRNPVLLKIESET